MNAEMLLKHAAGVIETRRETYGEPKQSMEAIARRWSLTLGISVNAAQVVLCLIDLKLTRLARNPNHLDSAVDAAAYTALLREVVR
jgi:hypothetical protein